jgi:thiol-disulfide isomerase/thioredoxin
MIPMIPIILILLRLTLAATFLFAALGKALDPDGSRASLRGFGLPPRLSTLFSCLLPYLETIAAALLVPGRFAWYGASFCLLLLLAFIFFIALNLLNGRRPDCHCFGQFHSAPIGYKTLLRNALLVVAASVIILPGRHYPHPDLWLAAIVTAAVLANFTLLIYLLKQNGTLLLRIEALENTLSTISTLSTASPSSNRAAAQLGLPINTQAPDFQYQDTTLHTLLKLQKPLLLIFTGPDCPACRELEPYLIPNHKYTLQVIEESGENRPIAESYRYAGTPSAVLINPDGTIALPLAAGRDAVRRMLLRAGAPVPGDPVPDLELETLQSKNIRLRSQLSRPTVLLFWNPDCSFCQSLLPRLRAWEQNRTPGSPRLLLIARGTRDRLGPSALESPILLDPTDVAVDTFAAPGTPSALLAGAEGTVATHVAIGGDGVMELLTPSSLVSQPADDEQPTHDENVRTYA